PNVINEIGDVPFSGGPRTHQTINVGLDKFIKPPAARVETTGQSLIHRHKHRVCLNWKYTLDPCPLSQAARKPARCPVGMLRVSQPGVPGQKPQPRRSEKTHLRSELPGLFRSVIKFA